MAVPMGSLVMTKTIGAWAGATWFFGGLLAVWGYYAWKNWRG